MILYILSTLEQLSLSCVMRLIRPVPETHCKSMKKNEISYVQIPKSIVIIDSNDRCDNSNGVGG